MQFAWYDGVGTLGVILILVAYLLMQIDRIDPRGVTYSTVNFFGSAFIALSLMYEFNFSAFVIEVCWMAISLIGIYRFVRKAEPETV